VDLKVPKIAKSDVIEIEKPGQVQFGVVRGESVSRIIPVT
jgi:hypothetical protein